MTKLFKWLPWLVAGIIIGWGLLAEAHEDNGWRHVKGTTHIVGSQDCPVGRLWFVTDPDDIGPVIECRFVRFIHNKQHGLSYEPVDGTCDCDMANP